MNRRLIVITTAIASAVVAAPVAVAADDLIRPPKPKQTITVLPEGSTNPSIADGVAIGSQVAVYKTSGLGPAGMNSAAAAGTEERYIDTDLFPGAVLPEGVSITEAQGLNVLRRIGENLDRMGLWYDDVITMRVFLANPQGQEVADFAGWNRAYRQFFANTDLVTRKPVKVPLGTAEPAKPMVVNKARPTRFALEIENLPVTGWLVEGEVDVAYPAK